MIPLTTEPDPAQLARLTGAIAGRRCVVVGSAPLSTKTAAVEADEYIICVNGAISSVAGTADLWIVNSKAQDNPTWHREIRALHRTMLEQGAGRSVRHVAMLRGPKRATEDATLAQLDQMQCRYETWSVIDKPIKRAFEEDVCGRKGESDPCSAGVFATALALWAGAVGVRMVGFSFTPGYHYLKNSGRLIARVRGHVEADTRALRRLATRYGTRLSGRLVRAAA